MSDPPETDPISYVLSWKSLISLTFATTAFRSKLSSGTYYVSVLSYEFGPHPSNGVILLGDKVDILGGIHSMRIRGVGVSR